MDVQAVHAAAPGINYFSHSPSPPSLSSLLLFFPSSFPLLPLFFPPFRAIYTAIIHHQPSIHHLYIHHLHYPSPLCDFYGRTSFWSATVHFRSTGRRGCTSSRSRASYHVLRSLSIIPAPRPRACILHMSLTTSNRDVLYIQSSAKTNAESRGQPSKRVRTIPAERLHVIARAAPQLRTPEPRARPPAPRGGCRVGPVWRRGKRSCAYHECYRGRRQR